MPAQLEALCVFIFPDVVWPPLLPLFRRKAAANSLMECGKVFGRRKRCTCCQYTRQVAGLQRPVQPQNGLHLIYHQCSVISTFSLRHCSSASTSLSFLPSSPQTQRSLRKNVFFTHKINLYIIAFIIFNITFTASYQ